MAASNYINNMQNASHIKQVFILFDQKQCDLLAMLTIISS